MNFVSFAQNLEDVMLWRALRHIQSGFYIDVGSNDPVVDSVTKAFYDRGWHGINIEPIPAHHADLVRERPRDINLQCAVGAENGEIEIWECDVRGWATASSDVISQHKRSGHEGVYHTVPMYQLSKLCAQHASSHIHFLKIDVEGLEKSVIDGMDFSRFRPWIIVIEATRPNSAEESYYEWEEDILTSAYSLAYADGLNRFYVSNEHPELVRSLQYPPNVFDGYIRSEQVRSELRAQEAESKAQEAESRAEAAESKAQEAKSRAEAAERKEQELWAKAEIALATSKEYHVRLESVYSSTSWRITKPLRWSLDQLRDLSSNRVQRYPKKLSKALLRRSVDLLSTYPRLKVIAIAFASRLGLAGKLHRLRLAPKAHVDIHLSYGDVPRDLKHLCPRARIIFADLKAAMKSYREEKD